ncbi:3'-phosphoesterase [bacterium]|jgi:bifunctional non-homologous end joining protein LigD|nr:3'-phosphoesterase [bacterium]MBT4597398.1 3'-phosphoesterase [bacterium]MBT6754237.1 3'-phosphoesterase [bacterium]MBT7037563.1 3'-phosphoesterase [bacterium]MBT7432065.1 3'-phosphoesterase [bacterium]
MANMKTNESQESVTSLSEDPSADSSNQLFVIQKHQASRLHYDFRLEMEDPATGEKTLISWAVPKNLPTISGIKHLAIRVRNHDLDYINFEGEIPEGSYGAGSVEIWDKGRWGLLKGDLASGRFSFNLFGEKLKGRYQMVLTKDFSKKDKEEDDKKVHWLIWKREAGAFF